MDCTSKLNQVIHSDSEIPKKVTCARTKTEDTVKNMLAPHLVAIQDLNEITCIGVSTDGSNHGSLKLFPVVIQFMVQNQSHEVHGMKSKLVELSSKPNEKSETSANYVTQALRDHGLLTKCDTFSGENINTNFGGINRFGNKNIFHAWKYEFKKEIVSAGCPVHFLHNCIQHRADTLSVDIQSIIMKIYNYFCTYTVRTEDPNSYCEFVDINCRQLLSHKRRRWLTLFPAMEKLLQMFPVVKSFFLFQSNPPIILKKFFENELTEAYLRYLHSIMSIFHTNIQEIER
jgi:hypothetical protein